MTEIVKGWLLPTLTYLLTLATGVWLGMQLKHRQVERYKQLATQTTATQQTLLNSLHQAAIIAQKNQTIALKDEKILSLHQRIRSDSIAHLTDLQAIRAINAHLKPKN